MGDETIVGSPPRRFGANERARKLAPADVVIRPARQTDIERLNALYRETCDYHNGLQPFYYQPASTTGDYSVEELGRFFSDPDAIVLVAEVAGLVVGSAVGFIHRRGPRYLCYPYVMLDDLVVDPTYQNQGVGKQLLKSFVRAVASQAVGDCRLMVACNNRKALDLYLKEGFVPIQMEMQKSMLVHEQVAVPAWPTFRDVKEAFQGPRGLSIRNPVAGVADASQRERFLTQARVLFEQISRDEDLPLDDLDSLSGEAPLGQTAERLYRRLQDLMKEILGDRVIE